MKRVVPNSFIGKLKVFLTAYRYKIISIMIWCTLVLFSANAWSKKPEPEQMSQVCISSESVKKGDLLPDGSVTKRLVSLSSMPQNSIHDCGNNELYKFPVLFDVQAGDLLQLSMFQKPEELGTLKDQLSQKQQIVYLPVKDLHSFPQPLEIGQIVSILGKAKKSDEAIVLLPSVQIADISFVQTDSDQEQIHSIGFALDESSSLQLTKALADGWFLIAVDVTYTLNK